MNSDILTTIRGSMFIQRLGFSGLVLIACGCVSDGEGAMDAGTGDLGTGDPGRAVGAPSNNGGSSGKAGAKDSGGKVQDSGTGGASPGSADTAGASGTTRDSPTSPDASANTPLVLDAGTDAREGEPSEGGPVTIQDPSGAELPMESGYYWFDISIDDAGNDWTTSTLVITDSHSNADGGLDLQGRLDWFRRRAFVGSEFVTGTYDPDSPALQLNGNSIENGSGLVIAVYEATFESSAGTMAAGSWSIGVPGTFEASRRLSGAVGGGRPVGDDSRSRAVWGERVAQ